MKIRNQSESGNVAVRRTANLISLQDAKSCKDSASVLTLKRKILAEKKFDIELDIIASAARVKIFAADRAQKP